MLMTVVALALASASLAQDDTIEVEGVSVGEARMVLQRAEQKDAAYFADPVCPGVGGLAPELSAGILAEARNLLEESGVPLGEDGACAPNLFIIAVPDSAEAIRDLRKSQPTLFNQMSAPDYRSLVEGSSPVRSFRSSIARGADGRGLQSGGTPVLGLGGSEGGEQLSTTRNSRIGTSVRRDVEQSFVYLDAAALRGLTLRQIGHYGAVVGTLPIAPSRADRLDGSSIAKLFASDKPLAEATALDKMMLRASQ